MAGTNFINRAALSSHFIPRTVAKSIQSFANPAAPSYELAGGIGGAILPAWVNLDIPDEKSSRSCFRRSSHIGRERLRHDEWIRTAGSIRRPSRRIDHRAGKYPGGL